MKTEKIFWPTTLFLILNALFAAVMVPLYIYLQGVPSWQMLAFALAFAAATNLAITAGYHRCLSHRSYDAHPAVKFILLFIGASAWQGSALKWCSDHRKHHAKVDSEDDPYSISRGFWFAHMGWLFLKESVDQPIHAPDLKADRMVAWQDRYYIPYAIFASYAFPTLVGWAMGQPLAGFIFAGSLRILLTQQSTFLVNSLAHTHGKQSYCADVSARDSILVAVLTHGEGYHSFHHKFQVDYRNGIRWYHWDPTKWIIRSLAFFGLATKLRRISDQEILKARLQMEELRLRSKGFSSETLESIRNQILTAQATIRNIRLEMKRMREDLSAASKVRYQQLREELENKKREFRFAQRRWKQLLESQQRLLN